MSANTLSNTVIAETKVKAPRVKKPTLSAKYSKFQVFGYGLIKSLQSQGVLTDEGVETAYEELKLLSSIEDQTQFYESILEQSKETGKVMRKYVTQRLAPPKAPRAKKPRAKKEAKVEEITVKVEEVNVEETKTGDKKKKKAATRTKKATRVESDESTDFVAELVNAANAVPEVNADDKKAQKEAEKKAKTEAKEAKEAEKKAKVEAKAAKDAEKKTKAEAKEVEKKAKTEAKEAKEAEKKAKTEAKEAKEAEKKAKVETKEAKEAEKTVKAEAKEEEVINNSESDDEEINTQETDINGKTYLIDDDNTLYSCVTHEEIGQYDTESQTIVPL
jgi:hypothetical protein